MDPATTTEWGTRITLKDGDVIEVEHESEAAFLEGVAASVDMCLLKEVIHVETREPGASWGYVMANGTTLQTVLDYWKARIEKLRKVTERKESRPIVRGRNRRRPYR